MSDEFPKKINLFKLGFNGEKKIYKYSNLPEDIDLTHFNRRGSHYFSLKLYPELDHEEIPFQPDLVQKIIEDEFRARLKSASYELQGKYNAYKKSTETDHGIFKMFDGFQFRFLSIKNDLFIVIDYKLIIKSSSSLKELMDLNVSKNLLIGKSVELKDLDQNNKGKLLEIGDNTCFVDFYNQTGVEEIDSKQVYPLCRPEVLRAITRDIGKFVDVVRLQRNRSLINPRRRLSKIKEIVKTLNDEIFPLSIEHMFINLNEGLLPIEESGYVDVGDANWETSYDGVTLCEDHIEEPYLQFDGASFIKPYPTQYPPHEEVQNFSIALYYPTTKEYEVKRLSLGIETYLRNYFLADEVNIVLHNIDKDPTNDQYVNEIQSSLRFENNFDLAIIYIPEMMKYRSNSPYYSLKAHFASSGIPTQMITEKTFRSGGTLNFSWLNMCTAITAKCGGIPWVLQEELHETDIIIGMSFSAKLSNIGENIHKNKYVGFANVFNKYGKWCYFCGTASEYNKNTELDQITEILGDIKQYYSNTEYRIPQNLIFHISKRTRYDLRIRIYAAAKNIFGENCRCAFLTIDESNNYRCFDSNSGDGSLARGHFVYFRDNEILLSTTGISNLGRAKGTPKVLHITSNQYPEKFLSLEDVAKQVLALTKLNWASVTPLQREPVTINYANRLANIAVNMGAESWNSISNTLYNKPWFI